MKVAFLANGYHPPWYEGGRNVLRGWSFVFSKIPSFNFEVYSFADWGIFGNPILDRQLEHTLLMDNSISRVCGLAMRYLFSPNFYIQASYKALSILQTITPLIYNFEHLKTYDLIHLHNVSWYFFINKLNSEVRKISISCMSSNSKSFIGKSYLKKIRKIVVTSPKLYNALARDKDLKNKVCLVLPLPLLPSLVSSSDEQAEWKRTIYTKLLSEIKNKFNSIVLYMGNVNQYRFPLKLFAKLLDEIKGQSAFLLVITSPTPSNFNYLHKMNALIRKYSAEKNVLALADIVSPYEKEKILDLADVFIFPTIGGRDVAIDPPLSVVEALVKNVYVLSSNVGSVPMMVRVANFGMSLNLFQSDKSYEAFATELKHILKNEDYSGKCDKAFKELFNVKTISSQLREAFCLQ